MFLLYLHVLKNTKHLKIVQNMLLKIGNQIVYILFGMESELNTIIFFQPANKQ